MQEILKNVDSDKKDRIINSALEEFSKNSFNKASTNNIVKNAGISKGLLYHYFTSKKNLYDRLEIFAIEIMVNAILEEIDWKEQDIFARIKQVVMIKSKVIARYPYLVEFSEVMYQGKSVQEIKEIVETYVPDLYNKIYFKNIDFTLFKENVDVEKSMKITQWTMEKLAEKWAKPSRELNDKFDYQELTKEVDEYLQTLRKAFYK